MKHIHLSMRDLSQIVISETRCGKSREDLVNYLKARGWPEVSARHFVANALATDAAAKSRLHQRANHSEGETTEYQADEDGSIGLLWVVAMIGVIFVCLTLMGAVPLF